MNRVYIKTYGCQMNERDSAAVAELLRNRGYSIVPDEAAADIVLLNTCSIRDQSEQKADLSRNTTGAGAPPELRTETRLARSPRP